ncbi:hypothetical protein O7047_02875 [Pseudenterobacter timonensis]|uniref:Regulatory LuxR family protein n=1 Tax=Pseudenterobacter timonensis TaxID=1755099 RepID=A0AAE4DKG2_9ENTR|nr:hypothetical protein [Pseudenterobacter timonensis]MDR9889177.1 hypothetical protein [Pseudenterobacter timonensis]
MYNNKPYKDNACDSILNTKCLGCKNACLFPEKKIEDCPGVEYYIWPQDNQYLVDGIKEILFNSTDRLIKHPVFFIDFNYHNLGLFLSDNWLDPFKGTRLVLVTDKVMEPIAHYWFYHDRIDTVVSAIIFNNDNLQVVSSKSRSTFKGQVLRPEKGIKKLTDKEYALLSHLYHGESPKKVATKMGINVKSVYVAKLRIELKLGVSLYNLFL